MSANDQRQLKATRDKMRLLEDTFKEVERDATGTAHTRELTLRRSEVSSIN